MFNTRGRIFLTSFLWTLAFCFGTLVGGFVRLQYGLPRPSELQEYKPIVSTKLLDIRGTLVADFAQQRRELVHLDRIPSYIRDGIVAVEDKRFRSHWGIDIVRFFGMMFYNFKHLRFVQGGSTITQQLARNMFLTFEQTFDRKLKEAILAIEIERAFSKDEILELYLNQVYFGSGAYGVEAASQTFFGRHAEELDLVQCATLAALPANAAVYSPYEHPERCLSRRNLFLRRLLDTRRITPAQYDKALAARIDVKPRKARLNEAPYFVEEIRKYLEANYGPEFLYTSGATVFTTLDLTLQRAANTALSGALERIETGYKLKDTKRQYDSLVRKDTTARPKYLQGAIVVLEPASGEIRAMVGGRSFSQSYFNRAVQAWRQPGSAFKVFVYAAALDNGRSPDDFVLDEPFRLPGYEPRNFDGKYLGEIDLTTALAQSRNIVAVRLITEVGPEVVARYAHRLGIRGDLKPYPSLALGACEVTLLDMTSAFGVLDNSGIRVSPRYVRRIVERSGRVVENIPPRKEEVLSAETCRRMVEMMTRVVDNGTAYSVRRNGFWRPAAGKTGTTDDYADCWFVGFTPSLSCGVWVGYDTRTKIYNRATGGEVSAPIWAQVMKQSRPVGNDLFPGFEPEIGVPSPAPESGSPSVPDTTRPDQVNEVNGY
jgi:penicillin-binding protein 1A